MAFKQSDRGDVYTRVTNEIIQAIEAGAGDWTMPWHTKGAGFPVNALTGKAYRGVNIISLWAQSHAKGFEDSKWATYAQWSQLGKQVAHGQKASIGVVWKSLEKETEEEAKESYSFARAFSLFNACQLEDYVPAEWPAGPAKPRIEEAEEFFTRLGAQVRHGGGRAFYSPSQDYIQMPVFEAFASSERYYATLAHEGVHWTAHKSRLDRDLTGRFGTESYAAEELVAELGSAFICADLSLSMNLREDHASYIENWLKVLRSDTRAIFTAASHAQRAADFMHGLQTSLEQKPAPQPEPQPEPQPDRRRVDQMMLAF